MKIHGKCSNYNPEITPTHTFNTQDIIPQNISHFLQFKVVNYYIKVKKIIFIRCHPNIIWFYHLIWYSKRCDLYGFVCLWHALFIRPEKSNRILYSTIKSPFYYRYIRFAFTFYQTKRPNCMKSFLSTTAKMKLKCQFSGLEVNVVGRIGSTKSRKPKAKSKRQKKCQGSFMSNAPIQEA